jgi:tRNA dimethylallyltransferase
VRLRALALCGPTASGKSELASRLAAEIGAEVINADSRQIYAGMRVGTGWPSDEQFARAPHHGYGTIVAGDRYSAGRFVEDARVTIADVVARNKLPILVGGTGLYIEALAGTMPLDRPIAGDELRARVRREADVHPHAALRAWLEAIAPDPAQRISPGDRYRTLRAIEAALAARENAARGREHPLTPTPEPRSGDTITGNLELTIVVLDAPRGLLESRIEQRVRAMFAAGLIEEARAVRAAYGDAPALSGIGYAEALAYADGFATRDEAVAAAIRRTRAYAKRQQTWFRRIASARRLDAFDAQTPAALRELARGLALAT